MKTPTTHQDLAEVFSEEIAQLNGTVASSHCSKRFLFLRALVPLRGEVRENDQIRHGVAVRAREGQLTVHPYSFREVCTNGAIHVLNVSSQQFDLHDEAASDGETEYFFREAIQASASPEAFERNLDDMRETVTLPVRMFLAMASLKSFESHPVLIENIMTRFLQTKERTGFQFMNAVTSVARDESDPEKKWKLEEFGGGVPALLSKRRAQGQDDGAMLDFFEVREKEQENLLKAG